MDFLNLGFNGIQIGSHVNDWNLDAQELRPIFAVSTCSLRKIQINFN